MLSKPESHTAQRIERKRNFNYHTMPKPYQNITKNTPKNKPHKARKPYGVCNPTLIKSKPTALKSGYRLEMVAMTGLHG
jgi:hypothetical protein